MGKTLALRKEGQTVPHELTAEDLASQARKVMEIKEKIMKSGVHYGTIPGCNKPSLLKPGAEKLCTAFMLQPEFETTYREDPNRTVNWEKWDYKGKKKISGTTKGYIDYDSACSLVHIPTGEIWAKHVSGSCNNFEAKYRSQNPYDLKNTLGKMAEKRALVAAVLMGTALSDMFTQDIEDMPYLVNGHDQTPSETPKPGRPAPKARKATKPDPDNLRMATPKQVSYIQSQVKKQGLAPEAFFEVWAEEFDNWEDIPFHKVNSILEWLRGI
jgi:hypothetical protein